jgi:hypothetical protein
MEDFESHVYLQLVLGCSDSITSSLWNNKTWHYILTNVYNKFDQAIATIAINMAWKLIGHHVAFIITRSSSKK